MRAAAGCLALGLLFAPTAHAATLGTAVFDADVDIDYLKVDPLNGGKASALLGLAYDFLYDLPTGPADYSVHVAYEIGSVSGAIAGTFDFGGGPTPVPFFPLPSAVLTPLVISAIEGAVGPSPLDFPLGVGDIADVPLIFPEVLVLIDLIETGIALDSGSGVILDEGPAGVTVGGSFDFDAGSVITDFSGIAELGILDGTDGDLMSGADDLLTEFAGSLPPLSGATDLSLLELSADFGITVTVKADMPPVPLPAGAVLLPAGLGALVLLRRRRRAS